MITGVNHVQVNVPFAAIEDARNFYVGFLGLQEIARPQVFSRGGIWLHAGAFELHIGLEDGVERVTRAHVAYEVNDLQAWRRKVESAGHHNQRSAEDTRFARFQFRDPWGNNIEMIQKEPQA